LPEVANEKPEDRERALADWERYLATLDTAILSLIGDNDIPDEGIEAALDDILQSSRWHRRLQEGTSRCSRSSGCSPFPQPPHLEPVNRIET